MRILLTNDDGINAPGINILANQLIRDGYDVIVVAPDNERSAASHSITLQTPLRIIEQSNNRFAVTGSPVDSVIMALEIIMPNRCDLVISGINAGPNLGEDVLYSGTVAAAIEAMFFGLPAIAVSLNSRSEEFHSTAASVVSDLLSERVQDIIAKNEILNINVPAIPYKDIRGYSLTKTGKRQYKDFIIQNEDPRGRPIYWMGGQSPVWEKDDGDTDISAVRNNFVSLTPITPTFTNYQSFPSLQKWLEDREIHSQRNNSI